MDLNKTGLFISALRKQNGLTQKELAEKICVTDKAVSRWETGKGFPDVSNIKSLAEVLNVSITEIVNGERTTPENIEEKSDNAIIEAFNYSKQMSKNNRSLAVNRWIRIDCVSTHFYRYKQLSSIVTFRNCHCYNSNFHIKL